MKTYRVLVKRTDEGVAVAIFSSRDRGFGLEHRVDTTNCAGKLAHEQIRWRSIEHTSIRNLGGYLEQEVVLDITLSRITVHVGGVAGGEKLQRTAHELAAGKWSRTATP